MGKVVIRSPIFQLLTSVYEVYEGDEDKIPIGRAEVLKGFIKKLVIKAGATEKFRGEILNKLVRAICEEADKYNSNLSIRLAEPTIRIGRFFERFGFRKTDEGIYKRTAGSSIPPSVHY